MRKTLIFFLISLSFISCKEKNAIEPHQRDIFYDKGIATFYGAWYKENGIPQHVIALDLYSPHLTLNDEGYMTGTGTNLYLSDIFIEATDTLLPETTYRSDTTALPLTFLPGMNYDGNISGAYVLDITDGALTAAEILTEGTFSIRYKGDSVSIDFHFTTATGKPYVAQFNGQLPFTDATLP